MVASLPLSRIRCPDHPSSENAPENPDTQQRKGVMSSFHSRTESTRDDWQTPMHIIESLGHFDLDPCANYENPSRCAKIGFTEHGLEQSWEGRVWLNPPYGTKAKFWMKKMATHGYGTALIPPRMGAKWFHDIVLANCTSILFIKGRIAFIDPDICVPAAGNNAESILVAYGERDSKAIEWAIRQGWIQGAFWHLRKGKE